ncbi:MAG TPA: mevalonate kinase [Bellilinea sp.]|nr:mevalonate kinase [Bellilinea sp.]
MPVITASAPAKTILVGEHAVVYNRPAIAVPVHAAQVKTFIQPLLDSPSGYIHLTAPAINHDGPLTDLSEEHPLFVAIRSTLKEIGANQWPAFSLRIRSDIPTAAGMGSSAAVSVAIIRGIAAYLGHTLPLEVINALAYEIEKIHHGTPSGIDNTVVTYAEPILFQRGQPIQLIHPAQPLHLIIADSGVAASTSTWVGGVRQRWQQHTALYEALFSQIGEITLEARTALENGNTAGLGGLLTHNHQLLTEIGVSIPVLDQLVATAISAGAYGAKLTGSGGGGNIIALCSQETLLPVAAALQSAGAKQVLKTLIQPSLAGETPDANLP